VAETGGTYPFLRHRGDNSYLLQSAIIAVVNAVACHYN